MRNFILISYIFFLTLENIQSQDDSEIPQSQPITLQENSRLYIDLPKKNSQIYLPVNIQLSQQYDFVIVQSHSQYSSVISSLTSHYKYGSEEESINAGVIKRLGNSFSGSVTTYVSGNVERSVKIVLLAIPSVAHSPIPGGCCLTCALEFDSNIKVSYDTYKTHLSFQRASSWTPYQVDADCDASENPQTLRLKYSVFFYYVDENDLSEDSLYDGLWKMSRPDSIRKYGNHLADINGADSLGLDTETVFGQGVIFNVIVSDEDITGKVYETAYVPVSTYACNFTLPAGSPESCHAKGSVTIMVFCIAFALFGLVLCFTGYKFFRWTVFIFGCAFYWFFIFIVLSKYDDNHRVEQVHIFVISFLVSLCGGGFTLFLYGFQRWFYVVYLELTIVFGMFVSAIVFYTPFGYIDVWNLDYRFGLGFASCTLFITMIFLFFPKALLYLATSLLGSYASVMAPCYFLHANIHYIVLTVIYRLTVKDFGSTYLRRPFGKLEIILTGVWAFLFILGVIVQYCTTKKDEFHFSGSAVRHKVWDKFSQSIRLDRKKGRRSSPRRMYYERLDSGEVPNEEKVPVYTGYQDFYGSTSATATGSNYNDPSQEFQPLIHEPQRTTAEPFAPPSLILLEQNNTERQPLIAPGSTIQRQNAFQRDRERYPKIV